MAKGLRSDSVKLSVKAGRYRSCKHFHENNFCYKLDRIKRSVFKINQR